MLPPRMGAEPPASLLADLKAIHPTVELVNVDGATMWWMMDYVPNQARQEKFGRMGIREYDRLREGAKVRMPVLQIVEWGKAGFVRIGAYQAIDGHLPTQQMLDELRIKVTATEQDLEAAFAATERASTNQDQRAQAKADWEEYIQLEGPGIFKHARGRPMVTQPGLKGE